MFYRAAKSPITRLIGVACLMLGLMWGGFLLFAGQKIGAGVLLFGWPALILIVGGLALAWPRA